MKLPARLALPLFLVAAAVTAGVSVGLYALVHRTTEAVIAQTSRQLARITENALDASDQPSYLPLHLILICG